MDTFGFLLENPIMRGLVDEVRTAIRDHNAHIYIPNLKEDLRA